MNNRIIRKVVVFSVWCITISIGIIFFQSDVWNTIKHMKPEETFALHPEYFVYFVISGLLLIGLIVITTNLWMRRDQFYAVIRNSKTGKDFFSYYSKKKNRETDMKDKILDVMYSALEIMQQFSALGMVTQNLYGD